MNAKKTAALLRRFGVLGPDREWARGRDLRSIYYECEKPEFLIWLIAHYVTARRLVKILLHSVRGQMARQIRLNPILSDYLEAIESWALTGRPPADFGERANSLYSMEIYGVYGPGDEENDLRRAKYVCETIHQIYRQDKPPSDIDYAESAIVSASMIGTIDGIRTPRVNREICDAIREQVAYDEIEVLAMYQSTQRRLRPRRVQRTNKIGRQSQ
jgi:hypothetical protein